MTREEYLQQLRKYLKRLPKDDYQNAMDYFTEYFEEAGPEGEQQAMAELGTPKQAASEVLNNMLGTQVRKSGHSMGKILLITVLAVCAAPIGVPLAVAALALLLAVVVLFACAIVCVLLFGVCGLLLGGTLLVYGVAAISVSLAGASLLLGMGLLGIGGGILLSLLTITICKWLGTGILRLIQHLIR